MYISGYSVKPFLNQTGANNQGNEHNAVGVNMIGMDKPGLLAMVLSRGRQLSKMKIINMRGGDEAQQRRYFMRMLVVHPKVVMLRVALGDEVDMGKLSWAMERVKENEQRHGVGAA